MFPSCLVISASSKAVFVDSGNGSDQELGELVFGSRSLLLSSPEPQPPHLKTGVNSTEHPSTWPLRAPHLLKGTIRNLWCGSPSASLLLRSEPALGESVWPGGVGGRQYSQGAWGMLQST